MLSLLRQAFAWNPGRVCALLALIEACGGGGIEPNTPAEVTLNTTTISFTTIGETRQLTPTVTDQQGDPLPDASVSWSSSDAGVASVTSTGLVTAVRTGSAQVTAAAGSAAAVAEVTVAQTPAQLQKISGDGQFAVAGQPVATPPSVLVLDANGNPVADVSVAFEVVSGRGRITSASRVTNSNGIAQVGSWTLGSKGSNELRASVTGGGISGNPATFTATGTSSFDIVVRFLGSSTASQRQAFAVAQARWESLITGDLEDSQLQARPDDCGPGSPAVNEIADDVIILVSLEPIDGRGNVLGSAGPCFVRPTSDLPVLGAMRFDTADLEDVEAEGLLSTVVLHEMGHVLGFGSLWTMQGLLADPSLPPANGTDPHFTGPQAIVQFNDAGGVAYTGQKVPVEGGGEVGTADGHWRESVFTNELMTGFVDAGENPLSAVTVASLADQGYTVNLVGADPFSLSLSLRAWQAVRRIDLGNDLLRLPIRKIDASGRVVGFFHQ
jgi:hypothetical protein